MRKTIQKHLLIILFLIFYIGIIGYKFVYYKTPFYDWDEAIYAQVGREMVEGRFLVPVWQGQFWLDKPPLAPLAYGIVEKIIPLEPELSTRFFTLFLTIIILAFCYVLYLRTTKDKLVALLIVVFTSFLPIFLQRVQVLNVDIFLLLGWLGYIVFFPNYWFTLIFLAFGVLSKSLLGFYPAALFLLFKTYQFFIKKIGKKEYVKYGKLIISQVFILMLWYVIMLVVFKNEFIKAHFLESHLKRVTASIESHFGKRTFYVDSLFEQLGLLKFLLPVGFLFILWEFLKNKDEKKLLDSFFFVPWFIFLNLTKTKIAWYLYAVLPQFAFLAAYPFHLLKKYKFIYSLFAILIILVILSNNLKNNTLFGTQYSNYDQNYYLANYAKNKCLRLSVLVDKETRNTYNVLKSMNLTISTSAWWGNHPSIVYYFGKRVDFVYDKEKFLKELNSVKNDCFVLYENDFDGKIINSSHLKLIYKFQDLNLLKK